MTIGFASGRQGNESFEMGYSYCKTMHYWGESLIYKDYANIHHPINRFDGSRPPA